MKLIIDNKPLYLFTIVILLTFVHHDEFLLESLRWPFFFFCFPLFVFFFPLFVFFFRLFVLFFLFFLPFFFFFFFNFFSLLSSFFFWWYFFILVLISFVIKKVSFVTSVWKEDRNEGKRKKRNTTKFILAFTVNFLNPCTTSNIWVNVLERVGAVWIPSPAFTTC